ncbi:MAG TPA: DUF5665 domain-containing protein [Bacilli bacterium]|nr:DUF5665 domain-containing protein [Bacilli bacterium]
MWKTKYEVSRPSERVQPPRSPEMAGEAERVRLLSEQVERLADHLERMNFAEYVQLLNKPKRMIFLSLIGGIARGVGIAIGFTIIAATLLYFLQKLVGLNLPIIGDFIADIVKIVDAQLNTPSY